MQTHMNNIQTYINNYNEKITTSNAQQAVDDFLSNYSTWKNVVGYMVGDKDGEREYGNVLVIFSVAIYEVNPITEGIIDTLIKEVQEYENKVKYMFEIKLAIYGNLGFCWHKLGLLYDNKAIEAFKIYIYYQLTLSSHTSYSPTCYAFRPCSKYLFQSLIDEQLNLSSPTTFNDIFDCPILELLNNDDEISRLIRDSYRHCAKVACFVSNIKLPYEEHGNIITEKKKHRKDKKEFLNELMWAHYVDSHKGICIKYKFPNNLTHLGDDNKFKLSYFKDVNYSNDLKKYSLLNTITMEDVFFKKGKKWEYENELRFLYFDINGNSDYDTTPIPNSIEAIYFGVKCSDKDKQTIKNILKDKKCVSYKSQWIDNAIKEIKEEKNIEFYQMKINDKVFGAIKAVNDTK